MALILLIASGIVIFMIGKVVADILIPVDRDNLSSKGKDNCDRCCCRGCRYYRECKSSDKELK